MNTSHRVARFPIIVASTSLVLLVASLARSDGPPAAVSAESLARRLELAEDSVEYLRGLLYLLCSEGDQRPKVAPNEFAVEFLRSKRKQFGWARSVALLCWAVDSSDSRGRETATSEIAVLKRLAELEGRGLADQRASLALAKLEKDYLERSWNGIDLNELGRRIREFETEFAGAESARNLRTSPDEPYVGMRRLADSTK